MLRLIIPELLIDSTTPAHRDMATPALQALLARGNTIGQPAPAASLTEALCQAIGLAPPYPLAPLSLVSDGGEPGDGYWLRADPVYLHLNIDKLILGDPRLLRLDMDEASQLTASLSAHFQTDGLYFLPLAPDRWYIRLNQEPGIAMTLLDHAVGHSIEALLPRGEAAQQWRRHLNEAQMLLHEHPVNQARAARGALPVNSLWFWGGGYRPNIAQTRIASLHADSPIAAALAEGANIRHGREPDRLVELARTIGHTGEEDVVVLEGLSLPSLAGDLSARNSILQHYETHWFAPLLSALKRGRIARLQLIGTGSHRVQLSVTPGMAWKVWQRHVRQAV